MLRAGARNGGVVMVNFYSGFVDEAYNKAREALAPEVQKAYDALKVKYQDDPVSLQREELRVDREFAAPIPRPPLKSLIDHIEHVARVARSEEHTSELQSPDHLVCRLLLEKKKPLSNYFRRH